METLIAMDVHKRTSTIAALDPSTGEVVIIKAYTDRNDLARKLSSLPKPWVVAVEASRHSPPVCNWLQSFGAEVKLVHPQRLAELIKLRAAKTDEGDAETILYLMRGDMLPECYLAPEEVAELRALTRGRNSLREMATKARNIIHALLAQGGIILERSDLRGKAAREELAELIDKLGDLTGLMAGLFVTLLDDIEEIIKVVESEIDQQVEQHPVAKELASWDGTGNVLALSVVAELGDIRRFPHYKNLFSYGGLVPRISQSGDSKHDGELPKYCNRHLRRVAVQAAQCMVMCNADSKAKATYKRLAGHKGANTAKIAAARKVLLDVYFAWHQIIADQAA